MNKILIALLTLVSANFANALEVDVCVDRAYEQQFATFNAVSADGFLYPLTASFVMGGQCQHFSVPERLEAQYRVQVQLINANGFENQETMFCSVHQYDFKSAEMWTLALDKNHNGYVAGACA